MSAQPSPTLSDNQILIALITLVELLALGGLTLGYVLTKAAVWIHIGVAVLVIGGALAMFLSWQDGRTDKGADNA